MKYHPINLVRNYIHKKSQEKQEILERGQRRSKLYEKLKETRVLLQRASIIRCHSSNRRNSYFPDSDLEKKSI